MDFFTIVENSFRDYRKNLYLIVPHLIEYVLDFFFLIFFGTVIIISLGISSFSLNLLSFRPNFSFNTIAILLFSIFSLIFIFLIVNAGKRASIIYMAKETYEIKKSNLSSGFKGAKEYWAPIFLYILIVCIFFLITLLLPVFFMYIKKKFLAIFSFIFMLGLFSVFSFFTFFAPQKIVVEGCSMLQGLKKSFRFVMKNLLNVILYGLLVSLFYFGLAIIYIPLIYAPDYIVAFLNLIFLIISILAPPYFEVLKTYMVMADVPWERRNP